MQIPILGFDIPFGADNGTWAEAGQYCVWTQRYAHDAELPRVTELAGGEVREAPGDTTSFRLIPAGMAHRIAPLFGYWRISDADTLFFRSLQDADVRCAVVVSVGATTYANEQWLRTCPRCHAELARASFDAKRLGFPAFLQFAAERERAFDADAALRTCASCGCVHSPSGA